MTGALAGKRILIVEDEYFIASDLKRSLSEADAIVVGPVSALNSGIALAEQEMLDAAVLDVNLEGSHSYPLADALTRRSIPYMFLTGYDGWSLPESYRSAPRLAKPFNAQNLIGMLQSLCGQSADR